MKTETQDLTGPALDWAVAKCEGTDVWREPDGMYLNDGGEVGFMYRPSTDWSQGGPIIEREGISVSRAEGGFYWQATHPDVYSDPQGPTPLIAAMRCYVASVLGDEIEIPEELQ